MGNRAVLFTRVSTEKQTLDAQSQELREFAIKDGYAPEDLIEIAEKESARKRGKIDAYGREEDRRGIKRLKELVESDNSINALYLWELSRLGRRQKILMDLREFCLDHHINIIIKTPSVIRLLDPDGKVNRGNDMIFSFVAQVAESEMEQRLERFHRSKVHNASIGKGSGSPQVKFGYKLNEEKFYVIDETEAEIVRLIFSKCIEGLSMSQISKYLNQLGMRTTPHLVRHILISKAYTGEQTNFRPDRQKEPITRKYPVIISKDLWEKAAQARKDHQVSVPKGRIYYCRGLIICPNCGRPLVANSAPGTCAYRCGRYTMRYQTLGDMDAKPRCQGGQSININAMESITWCLVSGLLYPQFIVSQNETQRKKLEKELSEVKQLKDALGGRYEGVKESLRRLRRLYVMRDISEEQYKKLQAKINEQKGEIDADNVRFTEQIETLTRMLDTLNKNSEIPWLRVKTFHEAQELARQITDDQTRFDICHTVLRSIRLENIEPQKGFGHKLIEFTAFDGRIYSCQYRLRAKHPKTIKFKRRGESAAILEFTYLERFRRNK